MIRFACPRCKTVLNREDHEVGGKVNCPSCDQRLQIPGPTGSSQQPLMPASVHPGQPGPVPSPAEFNAPATPPLPSFPLPLQGYHSPPTPPYNPANSNRVTAGI